MGTHHLAVPAQDFCTPLHGGQRMLQWARRASHGGEAGPHLPEPLQRSLAPGDVVEIHTVVPPGCGFCGWYVQTDGASSRFSVDGAEPSTTLHPFNKTPVPFPRGTTLRIHATQTQRLTGVWVAWGVAQPEVYTAWLHGELRTESVRERTLRRAHETGLVSALRAFTGMSEEELAGWAKTTNLWAHLVALERLK